MTKRALIQSKFGNRCAYCGRELDYREVTLDHVVPKCKGGTKDEENLYPACRSCNEMKASLDMDEFRKRMGRGMFYFERKAQHEARIVEAAKMRRDV